MQDPDKGGKLCHADAAGIPDMKEANGSKCITENRLYLWALAINQSVRHYLARNRN